MSVALSVNAATLDLRAGLTQQLKATVTGGNGGVTWSTSNGSVASVNNAGLVTAVGAGTATLTATTVNTPTQTATVAVRVAAAMAVNLSDPEHELTQYLLEEHMKTVPTTSAAFKLALSAHNNLKAGR